MRASRPLMGILLVQTAASFIVPTPEAPPLTNALALGDTIRDLKRVVGGYVKRLLSLGLHDELEYYGDYESYGGYGIYGEYGGDSASSEAAPTPTTTSGGSTHTTTTITNSATLSPDSPTPTSPAVPSITEVSTSTTTSYSTTVTSIITATSTASRSPGALFPSLVHSALLLVAHSLALLVG